MSKYVVRDRYAILEETYLINVRKEIHDRPDVVAGLVAMAVREAAPEWVRDIKYQPLPGKGHSIVGHFRRANNTLEYVESIALKTLDEVVHVYSRLEDDFANFERFRELAVIPPSEVEA